MASGRFLSEGSRSLNSVEAKSDRKTSAMSRISYIARAATGPGERMMWRALVHTFVVFNLQPQGKWRAGEAAWAGGRRGGRVPHVNALK